MKTTVPAGLSASSPRATCPVTGGQIFFGACAVMVLLFALAAGGAVHHFDNFRVPAPALISDTQNK